MSRAMVALAGLACFTLARGGRAEAAVGGRRGEWIQLFNGRDLAGWTPKFRGCELGVNYNDTFRVENGVLKVCYDKYDNFGNRFGHLFHEGVFSHYLLRVEYRFVGEQVKGGPGWAFRNNGIMVHGERPQTIEKGGSFPASIEVQLLGGKGSGKRTTGNLCTPGTNVVMDGKLVTRHVVNSSSETYHGDQWVTILVEVRGNERIRHIIDGKVVLEYEKPQLDERDGHSRKLMEAGAKKMLDRGTISIQAESHPTEFRKIELLRLKH